MGRRTSGGKVEVLLIGAISRRSAGVCGSRWSTPPRSRRWVAWLSFGADVTAEVIGDLGARPFRSGVSSRRRISTPVWKRLASRRCRPTCGAARESEALDRERYQTVYAAQRRRHRGADGGVSFHAGAVRRAWRAGNRSDLVDPACRAGYLSAGARRRRSKIIAWKANATRSARQARRKSIAPNRPATESSPWAPPARARWNGSRCKKARWSPTKASRGFTSAPAIQFRVLDALITNFHLPGSTPLILVAAFAGLDLVRRAYQEAIERKYRFYSYGDAMLILMKFWILDCEARFWIEGTAESPSQQFLRHCVRIRQSKIAKIKVDGQSFHTYQERRRAPRRASVVSPRRMA